MKRFCLAVCLLFCCRASLCQAETLRHAEVRFSPPQAVVGEAVSVYVTVEFSDGIAGMDPGADLILPALSGGVWRENVRSMQISAATGRGAAITFQRLLIPEKAGTLHIPPIRVRSRGQEISSDPAELTVLPAGSTPAATGDRIPDRPVLKARLLGNSPFSPGETAELEIELISPAHLALEINDFPSLAGASGIRLLPLPDGEETNRAFRVFPAEHLRQGANRFFRIRFSARALFLLTGERTLEITLPVTYRERDFFAETRSTVLKAELGKIAVAAPPPLPSGVFDTKLLGQWDFSLTLSPSKCRTGQGAELTLTAKELSGKGAAELFQAPEFTLPGCRIYPPDIRQEKGRITLRYLLVPLRPGKQDLRCRLGSYDPAEKRRRIADVALSFPVETGEIPAEAPMAPPPPPEKTAKEPDPAPLSPGNPAGKTVALPLLRNTLGVSLLLTAGGIALMILTLFPFRQKAEKDRLQRRRENRRALRALRRQLGNDGDAVALFQGENLAVVAEALGLPTGSTPEEIAAKITDPELQQFFSGLSHAAFSPVAERKELSALLRKKLRKFLAVLTIFLCLAFPLPLRAGETAAGEGLSAEYCFAQAFDALQQERQETALLWFTRALLLSPCDREARENRQALREKLSPQTANETVFLPVALRDLFRPDHHLLFASLTIFLLGLLLFLRHRLPRPVCWCGAGVLLFLLVLFASALWTQAEGPYSSRRLLVMQKEVPLRAIPAGSAEALARLPGGSEAELLGRRPGWLRIRANGKSGWVMEKEAERIFPYGLF